jgi:hypothetical protein
MSVTLPVDVCPFSVPVTVTLNVATAGGSGGFNCKPTLPISELSEEQISELVDEFRAALFASVDKVDPNPPVAP